MLSNIDRSAIVLALGRDCPDGLAGLRGTLAAALN